MPVLFIVKTWSFTIRDSIKDLTLQKQPFVDVYKINLLKIFPKFTGKHLHRSLYLMRVVPSTDVFSVISKILKKNIFFKELLWATLSDSSSQAPCLEIIIKILKWHQLRKFCWIYTFLHNLQLIRTLYKSTGSVTHKLRTI